MEATKALVLLLFLPGALIAGPVKYSWQGSDSDDVNVYIGNTKCASTCAEASKFKYVVGKTYRYAYEVTGTSSIPGASTESARVYATAQAQIHVVYKCEMVLTLTNVVFKTSEPNSVRLRDVGDYTYTSLLEENPLYFSFQDGRVEELCLTGDDNTEILNFKRGVLSAFQNSMSQHMMGQSLREIDVSGNCPTDYAVSQRGWKSTQFTKSKDLLGCTDRDHYITSLKGTPFNLPNTIQTLPLLKGDLKCSQTILKQGILSKSSCTESLIFRPFSKKESGAKTETTQKLELLDDDSSSSLIPVTISRKTSLIFEHANKENIEGGEIWALKDKLQQLGKMSSQGISKEVPKVFSEVVYLMKELKYNALNDLWTGVNFGFISSEDKDRVKQFVLDAFPMVGTKDSVKVMVDLLLSDAVTGARSTMWLRSFAFLQHPDKDMIGDSFPRLLTSHKFRMESLLPVTSAIHNYCLDQVHCESQKEVRAVVNILDDLLGRDCRGSDEDLVLTTLRAIGNLGSSNDLVSTLENCIEMSSNSMNVRVTATQAFRGITCNAPRKSLFDVLVNKGEDSELRINAYLGLMMCPTNLVLRIVKETLEEEEINQVGSFVWTHLTNLAETSSPHKQEVKEILQDEKLKKEFDMDKRKYSRNYEISYFSERFGSGALAESNVIWSSSSFMPRSAMLNLTVDVLGHSMNLIEVGGRAQGLQELLQNYIGNKFKNFGDNSKGKNKPCFKQGKMDDMKEKHAVAEDDLTASLYVRMFDNEMTFKHFTKNDFVALKEQMHIKDIMATLAKGKEISSTHSAMFLDSTVTVPTIAGMPLQLSVNGTASVQLKASLKMDLRRLSLKRIEINFDMEPSGAVQFGGEMTLNAGIMKSGLKMTTTMHSSTALKGSLDTSSGQLLTIQADTPRDKLEVLNVQSQFFIIHTNDIKPQRMLEDKAAVKQKGCSDKFWLKGIGYELCGDLSYVNGTMIEDAPYFPFTGPLSGSIVLHKRDAPQGFKLLAEKIDNKDTFLGRLSVDTPGSKVDRAMAMGYFLDTKAHSLEVEAKTPWKKVMVKGSYNSYKLSGSVSVDEKNYEFTMKIDKEEQSKKVIWSPNLVITRPKDSKLLAMAPESLTVSGSISVAKDDVSADIDVVTNLKPSPIKLQANYINKKLQKTISGAVILNRKEGYSATFQILQTYFSKNNYPSKIKPTILVSAPKWRPFLLSGTIDVKKEKSLKTNLQVMMDKTLKSPIVINMKILKSRSKLRGNGKVTTQFGTVKSKGFIDVPAIESNNKKKSLLFSSKIVTSYNFPVIKDKSLRKNMVVFSSKMHDRSSKSLTKYDASVILESRNYQAASFSATADLSHKDTFTKSVITFKRGPRSRNSKDKTKQLKIETSLNHKLSEKDADIRYNMQILYPLKAIEWQITGKHEHHLQEKFSIETYNSFIFAKGKSSEFRLKIDNHGKKYRDYTGLLELNYPTFRFENKRYMGQTYKVFSSVQQQNPNQEIIHTLRINVNKDQVHSMFTKFNNLEGINHNLISKINIGGKEETQITIESEQDDKKTAALIKVEKDDKVYMAESSLTTKGPYYVHTWDVSVPARHVKGSWEAGQKKDGEAVMKVLAFLDADKDDSKKIDANFLFYYEDDINTIGEKFDVDLSLKTPFEGYKVFVLKRLIDMNQKEHNEEFRVVWQREENEWSYKYWRMNPSALERFQVDFEVITPLKNLRMYRIEIRHKIITTRYLSTSIKTKYNEYDMIMDILLSNKKKDISSNLDGKFQFNFMGAKRDTLDLKIGNFPDNLSFNPLTPNLPKSVKFLLTHSSDGRVFDTDMLYVRDDNESKINKHTIFTRAGKMMNLDSKINIILPTIISDPIHLELKHANSLTNLNTTISMKWGDNQRASVDIGSTYLQHDNTLYLHYSSTDKDVYDFIYKHRHNSLNGWSGSSFSQVNKNISLQAGCKYNFNKEELNYDYYSQTSKILLQADYAQYPYTVYLKNSGRRKTNGWEDNIVLDGSVIKNDENDWSTEIRLVTKLGKNQNIHLIGGLKDIGKDEWQLNGDISLDVKKDIKLKCVVNTKKLNKFEVGLQSPWKDVMLAINHKKQKKSSKTEIKVKLDQDEVIVAKINGRYKYPEKTVMSIDLSTPYDTLRTANLKGNLNKVDEKWKGSIDWKSSNKDFKSFNLDFTTALKENSFEHDIKIRSSAFDKLETGVQVEWTELENIGDTRSLDFHLVAPKISPVKLGYRLKSKSWVDFQNRIYGEINNYDLDLDYGLKHNEHKTNAWLTFSYPGADKSFVQTHLHRVVNSLHDFDVGADLRIGKHSKPYNVSAQFSYVTDKLALGTTFESPFTKSVSYLLKKEVSKTGGSNTIYTKYGNEYMLDIHDTFDMTDSKFISSRRGNYLFNGTGHSSGYDIKAEWSDDGEEISITSNIDDDVITLEGSHEKVDDDFEDTVDVYITTPYDDFRNLELHSHIKKENENKYHGKWLIEYMDNKEADLSFDLERIEKYKLIANAALLLPIKGYEKNSLTFTQVAESGLYTLNANAITGQGDQLTAEVTVDGEELIFKLTGPIAEFEKLTVAGKYNRKQQSLNGDAQLHLSLHQRPAKLEYDIKIGNEPVQMTFKLRTPFENFKRADLTVSHLGQSWEKFTHKSILTSEKLGRINLSADLDYMTSESIQGKVTLTSKLKNMENLRLSYNAHIDNLNGRVSETEIAWDLDKEITVRTSWILDHFNPMKLESTFDMTTPFNEVKVVNIKLTESRGSKAMDRSLFIRHNDHTYLDFDMNYKLKGHKCKFDMRNPRPMSINIEGELKDKTFDGKMFLNWDKRSPGSRFEFTVHGSDKSDESNIDTDFSFKVIHPVRIMAVQYLLRRADNEMQTSGLITWDESRGNTFSYDIGYTDRSSMYSKMFDGHVKVGVPQRSVKLLGSYGDTGSTRTMTGTALWDADRDEAKKVTLSTSHDYSERMERLGLNLNLPSINKQLNVGVGLKRGYGSSILDSNAELSYSSDPRKTIVITNRIRNTVMDKHDMDNYNYTMETVFKHPITDIELQWLSHVGQIDKILSVGNQFTYMTLSKEQKIFNWRFETDNEETGKLMISSPLKSVMIVGKRSPVSYGIPSCSLEIFEDGQKTLAFSGKLRPKANQFDVSLQYDRDDPGKIMYINGGSASDRAAELSIFDNQNVYAKVNIYLNNSNTIHHNFIWKPTLKEEFKNFMGTKVTAFSYTATGIWDEAVKNVGTEVKAKYLRISQELRDEIGQVFSLMRKEMEIFNVQLETLRTKMRRLYNRNDLHIRDMGAQFEEAIVEILDTIQDLVKNYRSYYNDVSQATSEWINNLKNYPISLMYRKTVNEMIETMKVMRMVLEKALQDLATELKEVSAYSYKKYAVLSREIDRKLNSYLQSKQKLAVFKQISKERERLSKMGADYKGKEMVEFDKVFLQAQQALEDQYDDLMKRSEFKELHAMGTEIYQQFKYWNAERSVSQALVRVLDLGKNLMLMELAKIKNALMDLKKTRITLFDPMKGELKIEVHMPLEMKSLREPPEFKIGNYLKDTYKWLQGRVPDANSNVWDFYYGYVPTLNPSNWLPPFEASGYVIGTQHIITFDKAHYNFLGSCSHVLVRDMINDTFSVILNYDKNPRQKGIKSLCYNFGHSLSLEITKDYQLTVNNQETEMPFINEAISVLREGDLIIVRYVNGLEVISNPTLDIYKVILSGWYHGRVAGLLGNNDNEMRNDKAMVDRLHEYEVSHKYCSKKNLAVKPDPDQDIDDTCASLFVDSNSKFRPCFRQVSPAPFLQMCQQYMSTMSDSDAIHKSTEQYRVVCSDKGVFMGPMEEYLPCNKERNFLVEGTDPLYQSADVVFVVEDAQCNQWASSHLATIVTEMNKALIQSGKKDNRFGLAGYRGHETTARTIHGHHFGKANLFLKAVETLSLKDLDDSGDLVTAVTTAMKYPFRAGIAKVLVIIPCSGCEVGFMDRNLDLALKYAGFKTHVMLNSIPSTAIAPEPMHYLTLKARHAVSMMVPFPKYGTIKQKDYCLDMTSSTAGSILDSTTLVHGRGKALRNAIKSTAHQLGRSAKLPSCQDCKCSADSGRLECQLCDTWYLSYLTKTPDSFDSFIGNIHDLQYDLKASMGRFF